MERSDISLMKSTAIWTTVLIVVLIAGFFAGRSYQHLKAGVFFKVIDEREIPIGPGELLRLQHAFKSVGMPFLDPETSILSLESNHAGRVTLYEAERGFQESYPYVKDVAVVGNELTWSDGRNAYRLTIDSLASSAGPQTEK
jgi:hypothetical protein